MYTPLAKQEIGICGDVVEGYAERGNERGNLNNADDNPRNTWYSRVWMRLGIKKQIFLGFFTGISSLHTSYFSTPVLSDGCDRKESHCRPGKG